jgi:hypothetical protein
MAKGDHQGGWPSVRIVLRTINLVVDPHKFQQSNLNKEELARQF